MKEIEKSKERIYEIRRRKIREETEEEKGYPKEKKQKLYHRKISIPLLEAQVRKTDKLLPKISIKGQIFSIKTKEFLNVSVQDVIYPNLTNYAEEKIFIDTLDQEPLELKTKIKPLLSLKNESLGIETVETEIIYISNKYLPNLSLKNKLQINLQILPTQNPFSNFKVIPNIAIKTIKIPQIGIHNPPVINSKIYIPVLSFKPSIKEEEKQRKDVKTKEEYLKKSVEEIERIEESFEKEPSLETIGEDKPPSELIFSYSDGLSLPADTRLFYIEGKKGMGFEVFRGLLMLELEDRGRKPKLEIISFKKPDYGVKGDTAEIREPEKLKNISDDRYDYYKIIWIENCPLKYLEKKPELIEEVIKALKKGIMKYIVFAEPQDILTIVDPEEVHKQFGRLFAKYGNFSVLILKHYFSLKEEKDWEKKEKILSEIVELFCKILQINKRDINLGKLIEDVKDLTPDEPIDALWNMLWERRNSGLEKLRDIFETDPKVSKYLPPSAKLENESEEHFVFKQLVINFALRKGYEVNYNDTTYYFSEDYTKTHVWQKDKIEIEEEPLEIEVEELKYKEEDGRKIPIKRPDVVIITKEGKKIWVEVETCKVAKKDPLKFVKDKLRKLTEVEETERPDEIWVVFPYRKYVIYGKQLKDRIRKYFIQFASKNSLIEKGKIIKFKPRIFLADIYNGTLEEI